MYVRFFKNQIRYVLETNQEQDIFDMYEPLPNAPKDVIDSYNRYKDQISQTKRNISKSIFKG